MARWFDIKLTPGRGLASKLFHVGSYLAESDTGREKTVITRNTKEFNALFFLIFLFHLVNCLLKMISGFVICYAIFVSSTVSECRWRREVEKIYIFVDQGIHSLTLGTISKVVISLFLVCETMHSPIEPLGNKLSLQ